MLSIPIPAVRNYESASIVEAPAAVEKAAPAPAPEPASEPTPESAPEPASHVLHNSNGAIGIVTVGLATEKIDLNGRCAPSTVQCIVLGGVISAAGGDLTVKYEITHVTPMSACSF